MLEEIMKKLEAAAHEGTYKRYVKNKEPEPFFGVPMGMFNRLAKEYKEESQVIESLWLTGNLDAQMLAVYLINPKKVDTSLIKQFLLTPHVSIQVWDKLADKVISKMKNQAEWIAFCQEVPSLMLERMKWSLILRQAIGQVYDEDEAKTLLDEIYDSILEKDELVKWTMNRAQVEIALKYPNLRPLVYERAEEQGVYADMKVAKGCTSAYAPAWIEAVLKKG